MADDGTETGGFDGLASSVEFEDGSHTEPARSGRKAIPEQPAAVRDCVVRQLLKP